MTKAFLPEYSQMPVGDRYRPLFRLFADENWRFVRKGGAPITCDTAGQAIEAAKECVKAILNPVIRSEVMEETVSDILGIEEWRRRREADAAEEMSRAFAGPETVIAKGGRTVVVERRRVRA